MSAVLNGKVALVGAGAVGLYYGGKLALAGEDVHFLLRSDYDSVLEHGIRIESVDGDAVLKPVNAYKTPEEIGPVDWVIISWKATSNHQLDAVLKPLLHENTQVISLMNGLGNCEALSEVVAPERVLGGLCFVCLNRLEPGMVSHTAGGMITIGEWKAQPGSPRAELLSKAFEKAGVPSKAVDNLERAQWRKLVWNVPFNGLAIAEGGVTTDILLQDPDIEKEIELLMREVIQVAEAKGLPISEDVIEYEISRTKPMGSYRPSSMIDFVDGKPVEFEAIWAEPLRQAKQAGVDTPHLASLTARIADKLKERL